MKLKKKMYKQAALFVSTGLVSTPVQDLHRSDPTRRVEHTQCQVNILTGC